MKALAGNDDVFSFYPEASAVMNEKKQKSQWEEICVRACWIMVPAKW